MKNDLTERINGLDGAGFGRLKAAFRGRFSLDFFALEFERIQGSPGAHPASIIKVSVPRNEAGYSAAWFASPSRRLALADFLIRRVREGIERFARQNRGVEGSGSFHTVELGQAVLERDCVEWSESEAAVRFILSFPSSGRGGGRFDAAQARAMFSQELPDIVRFALWPARYDAVTRKALEAHLRCVETWTGIQEQLAPRGLAAFVADGSILPRRSGVDDKPLPDGAVPFEAPPSLRITLDLPNGERVTGLGIPEGVTVVTGGGFHGKSTLMQALCAGVVPHIPGDGREGVVTRADAAYVQAEEGRSVRSVDIRAFIADLPRGRSTRCFSTDDASGSTSQAAAIIEAIEAGSRLLLFDEDTCATNLLMRDEAIRRVLPADREPIRPLVNAIRGLWEGHGVSTFFVVGGLGEFLKRADTVLLMDEYRCRDISAAVRAAFGPLPAPAPVALPAAPRRLGPDNFDPSFVNERMKKRTPARIKPLRGAARKLEYGMDLIELDAVKSLEGAPQLRAIGWMLRRVREEMERSPRPARSIQEWLDWIEEQVEKGGLIGLRPDYPGLQARPPRTAIAAAINRTRSLCIEENDSP